jgi:hypothetical protein
MLVYIHEAPSPVVAGLISLSFKPDQHPSSALHLIVAFVSVLGLMQIHPLDLSTLRPCVSSIHEFEQHEHSYSSQSVPLEPSYDEIFLSYDCEFRRQSLQRTSPNSDFLSERTSSLDAISGPGFEAIKPTGQNSEDPIEFLDDLMYDDHEPVHPFTILERDHPKTSSTSSPSSTSPGASSASRRSPSLSTRSCPCGKKFRGKYAGTNHRRHQREGNCPAVSVLRPRRACQYCDSTFARDDNRKAHERTCNRQTYQ